MRNKITIMLVIITAALASYALCMAETTTTQMAPTPAPTLLQLTGTQDATLGPSRYPEFTEATSDNPTCDNYLRTKFEKGDANGVAQPGISLAPLWLKSPYGRNGSRPPLAADPGYTVVPELQKVGFSLAQQYKNFSKMLVTWTVRIEGYPVSAYNPWPSLCHPWHGKAWQQFPGGQVHTRLYVNGKFMGQEALISIPNAGTASIISNPSDPTLTGSYLLSKEDFGGAFPEKMDIEIRWYNDTCMQIRSPAKMRSLNITTVPITKQQ